MYTATELTNILESLCSKPSETEIVEFKRAESSFDKDDLGKYFSALSNEANLKEQQNAWLVFGIDNKTHKAVGSNYKPTRPSLDKVKKDIADQTTGKKIAGLIKLEFPDSDSRRYATYIPFYG